MNTLRQCRALSYWDEQHDVGLYISINTLLIIQFPQSLASGNTRVESHKHHIVYWKWLWIKEPVKMTMTIIKQYNSYKTWREC